MAIRPEVGPGSGGLAAPGLRLALHPLAAAGEGALHPAERELARARGLQGQALAAFCAGRQAARRLLRVGAGAWAAAPLLADPEGRPVLAGVTPSQPTPWLSISHGPALAAAALSEQPVGIDIEAVGRIQEDLWPTLFSPAEQARLQSLPRDIGATLLYGFKECVCKLLRRHEVSPDFDLPQVELAWPAPADGPAAGFSIRVQGQPWLHARLGWAVLGDEAALAQVRASLPASATDLAAALEGLPPVGTAVHVLTAITLPARPVCQASRG